MFVRCALFLLCLIEDVCAKTCEDSLRARDGVLQSAIRSKSRRNNKNLGLWLFECIKTCNENLPGEHQWNQKNWALFTTVKTNYNSLVWDIFESMRKDYDQRKGSFF